MRRLLTTIRCDVRLQLRNGFYYATALVVVTSIVFLRLLPDEAVALLLPVVILENVLMNTFYFVGGLILLEKGEGTLDAQVVTPLRRGEYMGSKLITLATLSLVESLLIVTLVLGIGAWFLPLVVGIVLTAVLFCLFGIALVVRYDSINEFLMPSVLFTFLLSIPVLGYFGVGTRALYAWHPLQGPLDLMAAGVAPLSVGHAAYAILLPLLWIVPVYLWSRQSLRRSVLA